MWYILPWQELCSLCRVWRAFAAIRERHTTLEASIQAIRLYRFWPDFITWIGHHGRYPMHWWRLLEYCSQSIRFINGRACWCSSPCQDCPSTIYFDAESIASWAHLRVWWQLPTSTAFGHSRGDYLRTGRHRVSSSVQVTRNKSRVGCMFAV